MSKRPSTRSIVQYLVFVGIGGVLLYLAFKGNDPKQMWADLQRANYQWVFMGMLCGYAAFVFRGLRWRLLLAPSGYETRVGSAINSVAVGYLANLAVPRLGEVTRCTAMHKAEDVPVDTLLGTVLAERVIDLLMLGLCFLLVLGLKFDDFMLLANQGGDSLESSGGHMGPWALGAAAVLGAALVLAYTTRRKWIDLPISRKVIAFLKGVGTGLLSVARVKKPVLFIAYTLLIWLMYFLMSYLYFFCLPETVHLHFADGLFVMMAGSLGIIAPSPGGIGAFHATVIAALVVLGIDKVSAGSLAIIVHSSQTLMTLLTGILALILLSLAGKKTKDGVLSKKV